MWLISDSHIPWYPCSCYEWLIAKCAQGNKWRQFEIHIIQGYRREILKVSRRHVLRLVVVLNQSTTGLINLTHMVYKLMGNPHESLAESVGTWQSGLDQKTGSFYTLKKSPPPNPEETETPRRSVPFIVIGHGCVCVSSLLFNVSVFCLLSCCSLISHKKGEWVSQSS